MRGKRRSRVIALLLTLVMIISQTQILMAEEQSTAVHASIVLTLGADLSQDQKVNVLRFFGITEEQVKVVTITNADEQEQLGNLISAERIGTRTLSCALVRLTTLGGIQVKTANMNYVTSNMIASTLSTSGVYNCEVLTAAPFEVSGTGALTGVMMAYEAASSQALDENMKELANEELVLTGDLSDMVGQDQATLVVNDIKIHIVRDQLTDQEEIIAVVDEVIETTQAAAELAAANRGTAAPALLGEVQHQQLYDFGYKFGQVGYEYNNMQRTLERVTYNVAKNAGIDDPIMDTFETLDDEIPLDPDSILLNTDDSTFGEDTIINSTSSVALGAHEADPIDVFTGNPTIESAGTVKAEQFISSTNLVGYKDLNGSYALMDLNGNILTESIYSSYLSGSYGYVKAELNDRSGRYSLLSSAGKVMIEPEYTWMSVLSEKWAMTRTYVLTDGEEYDISRGDEKYLVDQYLFYYLGDETGRLVGSVSRDQMYSYEINGDYLNIRGGDGVVTTYDSAFSPLRTAENLNDFGDYDDNRVLRNQLSDATGYSIYSFYGKYASFYDYSTDKRGVIDRYGNVIIPAAFDNIFSALLKSYVYESGGYFSAKNGDTFQFVTAGGTVTGSFAYSTSQVVSYGMSAVYKGEDGSVILLSGDGVETDLGALYSSVRVIRESRGMFYSCETSDGVDLVDWHGNVLLSGSNGYSVCQNGNYLIAQDGYTSCTLYCINGASPVAIASTAGGASELEISSREAASLDVYTGDVQLTMAGEIEADRLLTGTEYVYRNAGSGYALFDLAGNQITEGKYDRFEVDEGMIITSIEEGDTLKYGMLSGSGYELVDCIYDYVKALDEQWFVGYYLTNNGTKEDCDFIRYLGSEDHYLNISEAVIYHISDDELTFVELGRDQIADVRAEGEYLNVQERTTGNVVTYYSGFEAVSSARSVSSFGDFSESEILAKHLKDQTGYNVSGIIYDGYMKVSAYQGEVTQYGVIDTEGNVIIPLEYSYINSYSTTDENHLIANGYFCVKKDDLWGYATRDGISCEPVYSQDDTSLYGMAGYRKEADGTATLFAADGTVTEGYSSLSTNNLTNLGLLWKAEKDGNTSIIDWHGNVLIESYSSVSMTDSGRYLLVWEDFKTNVATIYAVDAAPAPAEEAEEPAQEETGPAQEESVPVEEPVPEEPAQVDEAVTEEPAQVEEAVTEEPAPVEEIVPEKPVQAEDSNAEPTAHDRLVEQINNRVSSEQTIYFGTYGFTVGEVDYSSSPVGWKILKEADPESGDYMVMMISEKVVDVLAYNYNDGVSADTAWSQSELNRWMNEELFFNMFTEEEREAVWTLSPPVTAGYFFGEDVSEQEVKMILLSAEDAEYYKTRLQDCAMSDYVKAFTYARLEELRPKQEDGTYSIEDDWGFAYTDQAGHPFWWLRSPGTQGDHTASYFANYEVHYEGWPVENPCIGVRPVIWINLAA